MRSIFYTLIFSCFAWQLSAQSPLNIFPSPSGPAQCPNNETTYYIFPWSSACTASVTAVGGKILNQGASDGKLEVTIFWQASSNSTPGRIELVADSTCGNGPIIQVWDFPIFSTTTIKPVISGSDQYYAMGKNTKILLEAALDTDTTVLVFEWEAPPGWGIQEYYVDGGVPSNKRALYISLYNTLTEGCIRVRSQYPCGQWSEWAEYCLQGTIPPPCPLRLVKQATLCGDTTENAIFIPNYTLPQIPHLPPYVWSLPKYTWTVPTGWKITSDADSLSYIKIQPDGYTSGVITVSATTNGLTSPVCGYSLDILPANLATIVLGPDYVCQSGEFQLNIQPPTPSEITWEVKPVNVGTPSVFAPDHGSGTAILQVNNSSISGYFTITYTITNNCGTVGFSKEFFVGRPSFFNTTIDGAPYNAQPLCISSHGLKTEVQGTDAPIIWSPSSGITGYVKRDSFVFFLTPAEQANCPAITTTATNNCGVSDQVLEFCPQVGCSAPSLDLLVYPNPAHIVVSLEVISPDQLAEDYALIGQIEVFNHLGQLVRIWNEPPNRRIVKAIADLPQGVYTLRATVWGQTIIKPLVLAH